MAITNIDVLKQLLSTAQASYGTLAIGTLKSDLTSKEHGADFTEIEAEEFTNRYQLIHQKPNTDEGFSATLFYDNLNNSYVFAIRGTEPTAQLFVDVTSADILDIGITGFSNHQTVDLYRYWKQLTTPIGQGVFYTENEKMMLYGMLHAKIVTTQTLASNSTDKSFYDSFVQSLYSDGGLSDPLRHGLNASSVVDVTGHSLGGHLAVLFARMFPTNTGNVVTENAPGQSVFGTGEDLLLAYGFPAVKTNNVAAIKAEGDVIQLIGFTHPGIAINISQEVASVGANHSVINGEDSLQLMSLFAKLDPSQLNQPSGILNNFMRASSNVPLDTYENMLDGLRYTLMGKSEWVDATKQGGKADIDARNSLYNNMDELTQKIAQGGSLNYLVGNVKFVKASADSELAKTDYGQFLSLYFLTPFALSGAESLLKTLNPDLYQLWWQDENVRMGAPNSERENFSNRWYEDRAAMLLAQTTRNLADTPFDEDSNHTNDIIVYQDLATSSEVISDSQSYFSDRSYQIKFGDESANDVDGMIGDDRLYGGGGNDTLRGYQGYDYLESGAGNDILYGGEDADQLYGGAGDDILVGEYGNDILVGGLGNDTYTFAGNFGRDMIKDSDGSNILQFNGTALSTLTEKVKDSHVYYDDVNNPTIEAVLMDEGDVKSLLLSSVTKVGQNIIPSGNSVTIKNYNPSNFTFTLNAGTDPSASANPATVNGTGSDNNLSIFNMLDYTPITTVAQFTSLNSEGGGGKDFITGTISGNDILSGGADDDYISGGFTSVLDARESAGSTGTDLIHGNEGNDWIFATQGGSIAYGDAGNDFLSSGMAFDFVIDNAEAVTSDNRQSQDEVLHPRITRDQILTDLEQHIHFSIDKATNNNNTTYTYNFTYTDGFTQEWKEFDSKVPGVKFIARLKEGDFSYVSGAVQINFSGAYQIAYDYMKLPDGRLFGLSSDVNFAGATVNLAAGHTVKEFANLMGSTLFGDAGDDFINGGMARDYLFGGADNDTVFAGYGNDVIDGGTGNDKLGGDGGDDVISGGDGDDTLWGGAANDDPLQSDNDWLYGGKGIDTISGGAGNDYLDGGSGADKLFGGKGNDYLYGGDDAVTGVVESDYLDGGEGDDILVLGLSDTGRGGSGHNIYILDDHKVYNTAPTNFVVQSITNQNTNSSLGDVAPSNTFTASPMDVLIDNTQGENTLAIAGSGGVSDLTLQTTINGDLWVTTKNNQRVFIGGTQDSGPIKIVVGNSVEQLVSEAQSLASTDSPITDEHFLNGIAPLDQGNVTTADLMLAKSQYGLTQTATTANHYLVGGLVSDALTANAGGSILIGGKGDDSLIGGVGDDTYLIRKGDGVDTITEAGGNNHIKLDINIAAIDVKVNRTGADLVLMLGSSQSITVKNMFDAQTGALIYANKITDVKFYDGTASGGTLWDLNALKQQALSSSVNNDSISAFETNDTLNGGKGNDRLEGGAGDDTYQYALGDGNDVISDTSGNDNLVLGSGISQAQVIVRRDAHNNLILSFTDGGNITIADAFDASGNFTANTIETIQFSDNSTWDLTRIKSDVDRDLALTINGTAQNDSLVGDTGKNILIGLQGDDQLTGGDGNDIYKYSLGDGNDVITDTNGIDKILLRTGITQDNIVVLRNGNDINLKMVDGSVLTIKGMYTSQAANTADLSITSLVSSLQNHWLPQAEKIIQDAYGLTGGGDLVLRLDAGRNGFEIAHVEIPSSGPLTLAIDMTVWSSIANGPLYPDRVIAHEMVHAVMARNMDMSQMPSWFAEGVAEFIGGADERVLNDLKNIPDQNAFNSFFKTTVGSPSNSEGYSASYIAVKLLDKEIRSNGGNGIKDLFDQLKNGNNLDQALSIVSANLSNATAWNNLATFQTYIQANGFASIKNLLNLNDVDTGSIKGSDYGNAPLDANDVVPDGTPTTQSHFNFIVPAQYQNSVATNGAIESIQFIDGTVWDQTTIAQRAGSILVGTNATDILNGNDGENQLEGGIGDDTLLGAAGNDSYLYKLGDGIDTITDTSGIDSIFLGTGISGADVILHVDLNNNLVLSFSDGGKIIVTGAFDSLGKLSSQAVENIYFNDGSVWDLSRLHVEPQQQPNGNQTIVGTSGDDVITAGAGNDSITGGLGNDQLYGGAGDDTYYYTPGKPIVIYDGFGNIISIQSSGDGQDTILDAAGNDTLYFNASLSQSNINAYRDSQNNLVINFNGYMDSVTIKNAFDANGNLTTNAIENFISKSGNLGLQAILNSVAANVGQNITGTVGNDNLNGMPGNDTITGGKGSDYLTGNYGDDTYIFNPGDGADIIYDTGGVDTLQFSTGINPEDVKVYRSSGNTYFLINTGDVIKINGYLKNNMTDPNYAIEKVVFANGDIWSTAAIEKRIDDSFKDFSLVLGSESQDYLSAIGNRNYYINGLAGTDSLNGGSGNDILVSGAGRKYMDGGDGNDTYLITQEPGVKLIKEIKPDSGTDRILFAPGINPSDITVRIIAATGDDGITLSGQVTKTPSSTYALSISFGATAVEVRDLFAPDYPAWGPDLKLDRVPFSTLEFADGTIWTFNEVLSRAFLTTSGNDNIYGTIGVDVINGISGDDSIFSFNGNDSLSGGDGNDVLDGGDGSDILNGDNGNDVLAGGSGNDSLYGGAGDDKLYGFGSVEYTDLGDDYLDGGAGNDQLYGGDGNDTYKYKLGDGSDVIIESYGTDQIEFGSGITKEQLIFSTVGTDLVISFVNSTDKITVKNGAAQPGKINQYGFIESYKFSNGDILNVDPNLIASFLEGDAGDNTIQGGIKNDVFVGHTGSDTLKGGLGDDEYRFSAGDGSDVITDVGGNDQITFDASVTPQQITVQWSSSDYLILTYGVNDHVSIDGWDNRGGGKFLPENVIETIKFSNGVTWSFQDLVNLANQPTGNDDLISGTSLAENLQGGAGNDRIYGNGGNDTLSGGLGNDTLEGGLGDDIYKFEASEGVDTLTDDGGNDTIVFGSSVLPTDVVVSRSVSALVLKIKNTSTIRIENYFITTGGVFSPAIENFQFANNTQWTFTDIANRISLVGGTGDDNISGFNGNDTIDGKAGNDTISGGAGNDTLIGGTGNDTLNGEVGNDLLQGGDGNDYLVDYSDSNIYEGGKGDDQLIIAVNNAIGPVSKADNMVVRFGLGDGSDVVSGSASNSNRIELGAGITPDMLYLKYRYIDPSIGQNVYVNDHQFDLIIKGTTDSISLLTSENNLSLNFNGGISWDAATIESEIKKSKVNLSSDFSYLTGIASPNVKIQLLYRNLDNSVTAYPIVVPDANGNYRIDLIRPTDDFSRLNVVADDGRNQYSLTLIPPVLNKPTPPMPTAALDASGFIVSGIATPGSNVSASLGADSATLQDGIADPITGRYVIKLTSPLTNGESVSIRAYNQWMNPSSASVLTMQDTTAPNIPTAQMSESRKYLSGSTEVGSKITAYDLFGNLLGTAVADSVTGRYLVSFANPIPTTQSIKLVAADKFGNISEPRVIVSPLPDTSMPILISANLWNSDGVKGYAKLGANIKVTDMAGAEIGTAVADVKTGLYFVNLSSLFRNSESIFVTATDKNGNISAPIGLKAIDYTAPETPTISFDVTAKQISGTAEKGVLLYIKTQEPYSSNEKVIAFTVADKNTGAYQFNLDEPLYGSSTYFILESVDKYGNFSTVDLNPPDLTKPWIEDAYFDTTGKIISGSMKDKEGTRIEVWDSNKQTILGSTVLNAWGSYSITLAKAYSNGEKFNLIATDAAGNVSVTKVIAAIDKTAPSIPTAAFDSTGKIIVGTAEINSTVIVKNFGGTQIGTAIADAISGAYTVTLTTALINKEAVNVTAKDAAGNISTAKAITAPDLTPPSLPSASIDTTGKIITGTAEASSTVVVKNAAGTQLGSVTANASTGAYSITIVTALLNGELLNVTAKDAAGNVSAVKVINAPDKTAPSIPTAAFDTTGKIISGVAEINSTVIVKNSTGTQIGTATADATSGAYSITLATALVNAEVANVTAKDAAGNISTAKAIVAPDLTAPTAPTASFNTAGTIVSGTAEASSTVKIKNAAGTQIGTATANATTGAYSITLATALVNKEVVSVTATDAIGNISAVTSATAPLVVDTTPPAQPTAAFDTTGKIITGTAEINSTVIVKNSAGTQIGTGTANATTGAYTVTLATALINKETANVTAKDAAGNISTAKAITAPDLTAPALPTAAIDTTGKIITGTAEASSTVVVKNAAGSQLGTVTANASTGAYTITMTTALLNGELLNVTAKDAAGNVSAVKAINAPDKTAPSVPTAAFDTTGKIITGTAEINSTVIVKNSGGTQIGTGTANATTGAYTVTLATALINKETANVTAKDAAGNISTAKAITAPDLTPPALPTAAIDTTGKIITGTAEASSTVVVKNAAGTQLGTVTANASTGAYSITMTTALLNGELLNVTAKDAVGNVSPVKAINAPDKTAPAQPTGAFDTTGKIITGTAEINSTLIVKNSGGTQIGTATANATTGAYTVTLATALTHSEIVNVTAKDAAGNTSTAKAVTAPSSAPLAVMLFKQTPTLTTASQVQTDVLVQTDSLVQAMAAFSAPAAAETQTNLVPVNNNQVLLGAQA